jgi:hypothetical protein
MKTFKEEYGETDDPERYIDGLFSVYLNYAHEALEDPDIRSNYEEEDEEEEDFSLKTIAEEFGVDQDIVERMYKVVVDKRPAITSEYQRLQGIYDFIERLDHDIRYNLREGDLNELLRDKVERAENPAAYQNESKNSKYTEKSIKETIIRPIVEKYLKEAEMNFVDEENEEEIEESTATASVGGSGGGYAYDAPAFAADKETMRRDFFSGGARKDESTNKLRSTLKAIVENSLRNKGLLKEAKYVDPNTKPNAWLTYKVLDAIKTPSIIDEKWLDEFEKVLLDNEKNSTVVTANGKRVLEIQKKMDETPELNNYDGLKKLISLLRPTGGNAFANKNRNVVVTVKQTASELVNKIVKRLNNYMANIYAKIGLNFNESYPYSDALSGGVIRKSPSEEYDGISGDLYEKLGYTQNKQGKYIKLSDYDDIDADYHFNNVLKMEDDEEFAEEIGYYIDEEFDEATIMAMAKSFKKQVDTAKEKVRNKKYDKNASLEIDYSFA